MTKAAVPALTRPKSRHLTRADAGRATPQQLTDAFSQSSAADSIFNLAFRCLTPVIVFQLTTARYLHPASRIHKHLVDSDYDVTGWVTVLNAPALPASRPISNCQHNPVLLAKLSVRVCPIST